MITLSVTNRLRLGGGKTREWQPEKQGYQSEYAVTQTAEGGKPSAATENCRPTRGQQGVVQDWLGRITEKTLLALIAVLVVIGVFCETLSGKSGMTGVGTVRLREDDNVAGISIARMGTARTAWSLWPAFGPGGINASGAACEEATDPLKGDFEWLLHCSSALS